MKISEWVWNLILIVLGLSLIITPFIPIRTKEASELIKIRATLKEDPAYYYGRRHDYGIIELEEYQHRNFEFRISSYSQKSLHKIDFFDLVKATTPIKVTISKEEYEERINDSNFPGTWDIFNTYLTVYGVETDTKVYSTFIAYNEGLTTDNFFGRKYMPIAGSILVIISCIHWIRKKRR